MASPTFPGDLARHGWSDRVQALVASADRPDLCPAHVLRRGPRPVPRRHRERETTATPTTVPTVGDWVCSSTYDRRPTRRAPPGARRGAPAGRSSPATARQATEAQELAADIDLVLIATGLDRPCARAASSASSSWRGTAAPGRSSCSRRPTLTPIPTRAAAELATRVVGAEVVVTSAADGRGDRRRPGPDRAERHGRAARRVRCRQVDPRQPPAR